MGAAYEWINRLKTIGRPVFLAGPAVWNGTLIHWYFMRFVGKSPFGATGSGIDLRSYWMGMLGCQWVESRKGKIKHRLGLDGVRHTHTHNARKDARELATVFEEMLRHRRAA
jgi:hypothetical protein